MSLSPSGGIRGQGGFDTHRAFDLRARAFNGSGWGPWREISVPGRPFAPYNLSVTFSGATATVSWTAPSGALTGYTIQHCAGDDCKLHYTHVEALPPDEETPPSTERRLAGPDTICYNYTWGYPTCTPNWTDTTVTGGSATSGTVGNLDPNVEHGFRVRAYSAQRDGYYSDVYVYTPGQTAANMAAGVTVAAADPVAVTEDGAGATYTVVLGGQPTANVIIAASSDNADVTAQPASLTFTPDNWHTPQTVTVSAAHDDDAADDTATVSHAASGADEYAGIEIASVAVSVSDDDEAGVTVSKSSLSLTEGSSVTYTVSLTAQPLSDVEIYVLAHGVSVQPASLMFTPGNWRTAQTVTVSAGQDDDTSDETGVITHGLVVAAGSGYESATLPDDVTVSVSDDDEAQVAQQQAEPEPGSVTVSASSLPIREGGSAGTYTVALDVEPTENVVITVSSDNGDVTAQPSSLTFTTGNWQSAQTVTVRAGQDNDKADDTATISHAASGGNYDGVAVASVAVSVTDDDSDRAVLEAFYDATGGHSWTNTGNWLSDQPLNQWHGVTANGSGQVTHLSLRDNGLSGSLPAALGKLDSLQVLSLDRNSISGSLPVELGNLSNLTRLAMNRNSLSGSIPSQLGNLSNLSIIGLARNSLGGSLPASLGNLSGLTKLSLHDNTALSGALPDGFTNLANLQRLAIANTGLCLPDTQAFDDWLDTVSDKPGIDGLADCASP